MPEILPGEKRIIETKILPEIAGKRLDHYLADRFTYRSRTQWQEAVSRGELLVNGRKVRPSRILHAGEILAFVPDDRTLEEPEADLAYTLLLDEKDFFAVSKSGNLPVHPSGRFFNHTLLKVVEKDFGKVYLVNRLDRETSGVTLFAKDPQIAGKLSRLFENRQTEKKYIAIIHGTFPEKDLVLSGVLVPDEKSPVHKKRRFIPDEKSLALLRKCPNFDKKRSFRKSPAEGEYCVTKFRLVKSDGKMSIVEVTPETGRLHQIRAVLCSLGCPLAGDKLYGLDDHFFLKYTEGTLSEEEKKVLLLPRQALHAAELSFLFPGKNEKITVKAPLPADLSGLYNGIMSAIL